MPTPQIWVLAGGNGAGKTTFYNQFLHQREISFVNADNIARHLDPDNKINIAYQAAEIAAQIRDQLINEGRSFCYETVFSHPSKIDFLSRAKVAGYQLILIFIHLEQPALNQARVQQRVSEGGHDVPLDKIRSRIPRTLANIKKSVPLLNECHLLDNSSSEQPFQRIASAIDGHINLYVDILPEWATFLLGDSLAAGSYINDSGDY